MNRGFGQSLRGNLYEAETNAREGIAILEMAGLSLAQYQFHVMLARIALARNVTQPCPEIEFKVLGTADLEFPGQPAD